MKNFEIALTLTTSLLLTSCANQYEVDNNRGKAAKYEDISSTSNRVSVLVLKAKIL